MWQILALLNKRLVVFIPMMMLAGFIFGIFHDPAFLKEFIIPLTFLMVYPMMVTLKIKKIFEGGDAKTQWAALIINFSIIPFAAYFLGRFFFRENPYMALGLLLSGLVPTSGMTISWTGFAKGNVAAAVKMTIFGLMLGSLVTPFYVRFLMDATIMVNIFAVMKQVAIIVFVPMIAGFITQQALIKRYGKVNFQKQWAARFPGLSTVGVLGVVFVAMALKAKTIAAEPQMLIYIIMPLMILYGLNFSLATIAGRLFFSRGDAIAMVYGTVMRNLSIALALAINAFGSQGTNAALVIAIAYIIQVQSAAWYVKFSDRIFGAADERHQTVDVPAPAPQFAESATSIQ